MWRIIVYTFKIWAKNLSLINHKVWFSFHASDGDPETLCSLSTLVFILWIIFFSLSLASVFFFFFFSSQMSVGQPPAGKGAACLTCKGICSGFQPHSWRWFILSAKNVKKMWTWFPNPPFSFSLDVWGMLRLLHHKRVASHCGRLCLHFHELERWFSANRQTSRSSLYCFQKAFALW